MKIVMVLTSHDQLGNTGRKTGVLSSWMDDTLPDRILHRRPLRLRHF